MAKLKNMPHQGQIEADIIKVLKDMGDKASRSQIISTLANRGQLTLDEKEYRTPGGWVYYMHRIDGVAHKLKGELKIVVLERGVWQLPEVEPPVALSLPRPDRHGELKRKMAEIGKKLGYHTSTEEGPEFRHDVLWRTMPYKTPSHVIEICDGGSLPKDFASLSWANQNWDAGGVLIVTDGKDFEKATRQLSYQPRITVVKADSVDKLCELIMTDMKFLRSIFSEQF